MIATTTLRAPPCQRVSGAEACWGKAGGIPGVAHDATISASADEKCSLCAEELRNNDDIKEFYLGLSEMGARKSYRDVKHYRRRKRWLS